MDFETGSFDEKRDVKENGAVNRPVQRRSPSNIDRIQGARPKDYRTPPYIRTQTWLNTSMAKHNMLEKTSVVRPNSYQEISKTGSYHESDRSVNYNEHKAKERTLKPNRKNQRSLFWAKTGLNKRFIENLVYENPDRIGKKFTERREDFIKLMRHCSRDGHVINILFRLFTRICSTNSYYIITLNTALHESQFVENTVVPYLLSLIGEACNNINTVKFALRLITSMADNSINSFVSFYGVFTVLAELVEEIRASDDCSHVIGDEFDDFEHIRSRVLAIRRACEKNKRSKEDEYRPPDDFRSANVVPTADDLLTTKTPFLRQNKAYGSFIDLEHYLDVQFRLLREDYVAPLRESIQEYKGNVQEILKGNKRIRDIRVYYGVRISGTTVNSDGLGQVLTFDTSTTQRIRWEHSKSLIYGSLLCLSYDQFETIWFAVVTNRETKDLELGIVEVQFLSGRKNLYEIADKEFVMAESNTYFEAYKHNLMALQNIKVLPFSKYIIKCQEDVDPPVYLTIEEDTVYDLNLLAVENVIFKVFSTGDIEMKTNAENMLEKITKILDEKTKNPKIKRNRSLSRVKVLSETKWPEASSIGLDDSQYRAVKNALTHEFSITQGPPGTGKTYVGLKIAKALLANKTIWSTSEERQPMLIVCYTNHALDQFLCGIHDFFSGDIVRVGGRSSSEEMQKHGIKTMYRHISDDILEDASVLGKIKDKTRERIDQIKTELRMADYKVLNASHLKKYIGKFYLPLIYGFSVKVFHINRMQGRRKNPFEPEHFDVVREWLGCGRLLKPFNLKVQFQTPDSRFSYNIYDDQNGEKVVSNSTRTSDKYNARFFYEHVGCVSKDDLANRLKTVKDGKTKANKIEKGKGMKNGEEILYFDEILPLNDKQLNNIQAVWYLSALQRWKLYKRWIEEFKSDLVDRCREYEEDYEMVCNQIKENNKAKESQALMQADIVGMTTTGAAKHFHVLQNVKPKIVIVEEAAEVLEAHIVTSLSEKCEHLILIGDHKQLKPSPAVYKLAKKFNLDISLFERMINNKVRCECLEHQHRMRPEISKIIRLFYPTLKDDESVHNRPDIKGIASNVYFISHTCPEANDEDNTSHSNEHEAHFLVALCRYLLKQEYKPSQITVLTTYSAQMFLLRRLMPKDSEFHGVNVTVVDNYQGEENDIILLSLVRSNPDEKIGFLNIENRINVALSRARNGLFVLGNFEIMSKVSDMWTQIMDLLKEENQTGSSLPLYCRNHPAVKLFASNADDFQKAPEGGCILNCDARLDCGHMCRLKCHVYDTNHTDYMCPAPCNKSCVNDHPCVDKCYEKCSDCRVFMPKTIPKCGHIQQVPCCKDPAEWACQVPCDEVFSCSHRCQAKCGESDHKCHKIISIALETCKHTMKIQCYKRSAPLLCEMPCEYILPCQHKCIEQCHQPHTDECCEEVVKVLKCGHSAESLCHLKPEDIQCTFPCEEKLPCGHQCKSKCGEPHTQFCEEPIEKKLKCGHSLILFCSENERKIKCPHKCSVKLECGHMCENMCSEPHTTQCSVLISYKCNYGHRTKKKCYELRGQDLPECTMPCHKKLACGHKCRGNCHRCENGTFHQPCSFCGLPEGRRHCNASGRKFPCIAPCQNRCSHRSCRKLCFEPCADDRSAEWPCREKCDWECEHKSCSKLCFEQCDRSLCEESCKKNVNRASVIRRPCQGFCGETCGLEMPSALGLRGRPSALGPRGYRIREPYSTSHRKGFLKSCGHALDISHLEELHLHDTSSCGPVCPRCSEPILMDEKMFGNTAKQIHAKKERKKTQSIFIDCHREIQDYFTRLNLKLHEMISSNKSKQVFEKLVEKRKKSFDGFLHFQKQGFQDLRKELRRLEEMAGDILENTSNNR